MSPVRPDGGSFRDPASRVYRVDDRILRALADAGESDWTALAGTDFFRRLSDAGRLSATERLDPDRDSAARELIADGWSAVLEHDRLPFVSYPYEWSFGMLRDAGILTLDLLRSALDEDFTLKDASAFNVQWRGTKPVFVDIGSFEARREGEPWIGYSQFCRHFLNPLLLTSRRGIDFRGWLRGSLDGIAPEDLDRVLGWRDRLSPSAFADVVLQARMRRKPRVETGEDESARSDLRRLGFRKDMIVRNADRLARNLAKLEPPGLDSHWADYGRNCPSYEEADRERKRAFVERAAREIRPPLAWDLGCNTGEISVEIARHAETVVAVDSDPASVELLYRRLRAEGPSNVLPLCLDLCDPSPARGWAHAERASWTDRGPADLVTSLALIHHLVIRGNVPPTAVLDWLARLGRHHVLEWVSPDDPMVRRLGAEKAGANHDLSRGPFEGALAERFEIRESLELGGGLRCLYRLQTKSAARSVS